MKTELNNKNKKINYNFFINGLYALISSVMQLCDLTVLPIFLFEIFLEVSFPNVSRGITKNGLCDSKLCYSLVIMTLAFGFLV